ncbi:MAG TPA: hypothetical protein VLB44_14850 [Kofleriaceae bacterium]|nr:hypothetical protein [Kofleriaceae bacterium]
MSESFVDLSYRGLALGKRIKLTQVRPTSGYLEMPTPMPVGTPIGIATDDGVLLEALVTEVHEQVGGSERAPGMLVKPKLDADAAQKWWTSRVDLPQEKVEKAAPAPDAGGKVTVMSPRMSGQVAVPELIDDGRNTSVMDAVSETQLEPRDTNPGMAAVRVSAQIEAVAALPIQDDGKRTMMMDAVDLAALGLDASSSGSMPAMKAADDEDSGNGDKPDTKGKKKKKKR